MLPRIQTFSAALLLCLFTAAATPIAAQSSKPTAPRSGRNISRTLALTSHEQRATQAFNAAKQSPLQLNAFLARMPKGADLHMHLSGAVYAETFIKDAAEDSLCVNLSTVTFTKPVGISQNVPSPPICGEGTVHVATAFKDQT